MARSGAAKEQRMHELVIKNGKRASYEGANNIKARSEDHGSGGIAKIV